MVSEGPPGGRRKSSSKRFEALHAGEAESEEGDEDDDDAGDDEDFEDDEDETSNLVMNVIKLKQLKK